jgi:hypothetical protein
MAKIRAPREGSTPSYPATVAYKQWIRGQLASRKWTQQRLVDEMKRADRSLTKITTSTITQFLGPDDEDPMPSNSALLPAMNKALGIAPPPVSDPASPLSQFKDRLDERWNQLSDRGREQFLRAMEAVLGLSSRD